MAATDSATHEEQIAHALNGVAAKKGMLFNILVTAVEVGGSIALFQVAESLGASDVVSYLIGSIAPVIGGLMVWARAREFSGASAAIFAFSALSAGMAFIGSTAPKWLLYKDCAVTALIGLIFLATCVLARKPLAFYMAQRYGTDGTREGMAVFDILWERSRDFRTCLYRISYLWAGLFVIQAIGTAAIIYVTRYSDGYNYDQILPWVAIGFGIAGSIAIARRFKDKGELAALPI
ncbi:MAG TPA: VC0807 family protein [Marmoricola sp.]|nr:VC0807 family protein [Marmoricola sp.]